MSRWLPKETREELPEKVGYLHEVKGIPLTRIAERFNISPSRICFYWKKYKDSKGKK